MIVTGVDPDAMAATTVGMQFDLPRAVAVRHSIDVDRQVLTRTVSDLDGVVEHVETDLAHACVSCAIRQDILPTLERVARSGRWQSVVAHLPVGAEAYQVSARLKWDAGLARYLRVSAVVTAVSGGRVTKDLLGDELLAERGHHCFVEDRRGVGEVLAAMVEFADVVVPDEPLDHSASGLLATLTRPGALLAEDGAGALGADLLLGRLHVHAAAEAWTSPLRDGELPSLPSAAVWRLDLRSRAPFHPDRLLDSLASLGGGAHRSRGCFWLPTRPDRALEWDGAGGQLSVGDFGSWAGREPFTRLVLIGVGPEPTHLGDAFGSLLVARGEVVPGPNVLEDGFEPWLGPIRAAA